LTQILWNSLGVLYAEMGNSPQAEAYLQKALQAAQRMGDTKLQVLVAADMVDFYLQHRRYRQAAAQLDALENIVAAYRHTSRHAYWDEKLAAFRRRVASGTHVDHSQ